MVNEKLILETIGNLLRNHAQLERVVAATNQVLISNLPDLSPEQKEGLQGGVDELLSHAERELLAAKKLLDLARGL